MSTRSPAGVRVKGSAPAPGEIPVEVDWGLAYELILGLRMFVDSAEDPTSYSEGPEWFDEIRSSASPALLDAIQRFSGGHEVCFGFLLGFVVEAAPPRDASALLDRLRAVDPLDIRLQLLGHSLETFRQGVPRELIHQAARGDDDAARRLGSLAGDDRWIPYEHVLSIDAAQAKDLLIRIVFGWNQAILAPAEEEIARFLRRGAESARQLVGRMSTERVVDAITSGLELASEPGVQRILLVPTHVGRPWVILGEHLGTKIICFAVRDPEGAEAETPPDDLVRVHKALGDETRLRLLRKLRDGAFTLQELVDHLGLAKSTVHAHMLTLRTSRLVRQSLGDKRYSLRPEAFDEARARLDAYIGEDGSA